MRTLSNILVILTVVILWVVVYYDISLDDIRSYGKTGTTTLVLLSLALGVLFKKKWPAILCAFLILPMAYIGYQL